MKFFRSIYRFFPLQLLIVHFKRNQVIILFWVLLLAIITGNLFSKIGVPALFLTPEYFGEIDFMSYFIYGLAFGSFIIAFNISSYIVNSHYFPFIATLTRPFIKYSLNNFIIPISFIVVYLIYSYDFQKYYEDIENTDIIINLLGFLFGTFLFFSISSLYFYATNKDIYKFLGIKESTFKGNLSKAIQNIVKKDFEWKKRKTPRDNIHSWRIETYIGRNFKIRRARDTKHYSRELIFRVLRQNHLNSAIFAVLIIITIVILGVFMDNPVFIIPAASSIILLFTLLIMFYSLMKSLFKEWSFVAIILFVMIVSFFTQNFFFDYRNSAYGLDYKKGKKLSKQDYYMALDYQNDYSKTVDILNNWKKKNTDPNNKNKKPKIVFVNASGGGMKAMLWAYYALAYADSTLDDKLIDNVFLITGSSGGMIGASYLRELYYQKQKGRNINYLSSNYVKNMHTDLLNPIAYSFSLNDWLFKFTRFEYKGQKYYKDRAYTFEEKLNQNTGFLLDKPISDYRKPEKNAEIPMMILTPTIINDGRRLIISSQDVSYFVANAFSRRGELLPNVEFRKMYRDCDADSLRFLTALRMNATFPYVAPIVALPGEPQLQVMDAGLRDTYGLSTSLQFLYIFRDWISFNTDGVVFLQLTEEESLKTRTDKRSIFLQFLQPMGTVYKNIFKIQGIHNRELIEFSNVWMKDNVEFVNLYLKGKEERISLSWHLTKREVDLAKSSFELEKNKLSLQLLDSLIDRQ